MNRNMTRAFSQKHDGCEVDGTPRDRSDFLTYVMTLLRCPIHREPLSSTWAHNSADHQLDSLICPRGCRFPFVHGIPRFVDSKNYATAFGKQWNLFRKTQLDSNTGTNISRERLVRCLGRSLGTLQWSG